MDLRDSVPFAAHHNCTTGCVEYGDHPLEEDIQTILDFEECEHAIRERQYLSILEEGEDYFEDYKAQALKEYFDEEAAWKHSACRSSLLARLSELELNCKQGTIANAFAMGLNKLGFGGAGVWPCTGRIHELTQLAIFLDIAEHLETVHNRQIARYAQEPDFRPVDKAVLAELGVQVLEEPEAEMLCSDDTFYFLPFCPWPMLELVDRDYSQRPSLMIGNMMSHIQELHNRETKGLLKPLRSYKTFDVTEGCTSCTKANGQMHDLHVLDGLQVWSKVARRAPQCSSGQSVAKRRKSNKL